MKQRIVQQYGAPASMLITLGSEGAEWVGLRMPAHHVEADDVFCGVLSAALTEFSGREDVMRRAALAAAEVVAREGVQ